MILFVFEGKKQEPRLYKTMEYLFFNRQTENEMIVSYCSNIYSLYQKMIEYEVFGASDSVALLQLLKEEECAHPETANVLQEISFSDEISEIYLFFDYTLKRLYLITAIKIIPLMQLLMAHLKNWSIVYRIIKISILFVLE